MLRLNNIVKKYVMGDSYVEALKGVDLAFRQTEFVSILGPSGCGKTTLLNIIGGLDKYTSGDLFINGKSTKDFTDKDWDVYRNHRIGFIFQSYNLIPHQTILGNVELALTISGISKQERADRAKKALDKVGLKDLYNKKPNQLSGGQCQRVAIARALVNEPEILLADEPTGALDTVTSVQIMDLIKEISKERLVIMVTHNPDLADKYSTRIVNLLDGNVVKDSNPFSSEDEIKEVKSIKAKETREIVLSKEKTEKAKMSFWTAFKLSAKNLHSKLKRTLLVVLAGSIGIIGVSAVLSISTGVHDYINSIQDDLLSGNPIKIKKSGVDYETILNNSSLSQKSEIASKIDGRVNINSIISYLTKNESSLQELVFNNEFDMDYVNYVKSMPKEYYKEIYLKYGIDITPNVYTDYHVFKDDPESLKTHSEADIVLANKYSTNMSLNAITEAYTALLNKTPYAQYSSYITSLADVLQQDISNTEYIKEQYDVLYGDIDNFGKKNPHGIVVVLSNDQSVSDLLLTQLGYFSMDEFINMIFKANPEELKGDYVEALDRTSYSYEEIAKKKFRYYPHDTIYKHNQSMDISSGFIQRYPYYWQENPTWNDGIELSISAIVKPKKNVSYGALYSGFVYSEDFAREIIELNKNSQIVTNVKAHGSITSTSYPILGSDVDIGIYYDGGFQYTYYDMDSKSYKEDSNKVFVGQNNAGVLSTFSSYLSQALGNQTSQSGSSTNYSELFKDVKTMDINGIGGTYLPISISVFPNSFDDKYLVTDYLDDWSNLDKTVTFNVYSDDFSEVLTTKTLTGSERVKVKYTDGVALIITMINQLIDIVTYALVGFTALSLVVSTVMIAIITYVSVVERIKEIGVIRSLGGRKRDVSNLFYAETFMIGLASGVFGIVITEILSLIANIVVNNLSNGAVPVIAHLTWSNALIMIILSIVLTSIAGIIPARSAAKKDPVIALRTE